MFGGASVILRKVILKVILNTCLFHIRLQKLATDLVVMSLQSGESLSQCLLQLSFLAIRLFN